MRAIINPQRSLWSILCGTTLLFSLNAPAQGLAAVAPVSPNASPEARALLNYIRSIYGHRTLSGQMWSPWGIDEIATVFGYTGKYPALRGQDLIHERDNNREIQLAIEWWRAGGIPTIMWHWGAPSRGEGYQQSQETIDIDRCFQSGTPENLAMWNDLRRIADQLVKLRDANVPVLWRPMHEMDGGWFWYGKGGGQRFIRLWRTMFDYFVHERGLNNLIWVLCYSGEVRSGWDPGREYYDIAGPDNYGTGIQAGMFRRIQAIHGMQIPIPYHECGTIPDPAESFRQGITWSWWMLWHTGHLSNHNRQDLIAAYNHELVITRDELPNIMTFLSSSPGNPLSSSSGILSSATSSSSTCTPTAISPFVQIDANPWQNSSNAEVLAGSTVRLGPQPLTGGSWSWVGPSGFSSSMREITIANMQINNTGTYRATYTNPAGCRTSREFEISMARIVSVQAWSLPTLGLTLWENQLHQKLGSNLAVRISIHSLEGNLLLQRRLLPGNTFYMEGILPAGLYVIRGVPDFNASGPGQTILWRNSNN